MAGKIRLDQHLVDLGHYPSRSRARDAVLRGTVFINKKPAAKPAQIVPADAVISIDDEAQAYVSRAALKLKHALQHFQLDVAGLHALDLGASTGGFTQVLLENGVASVHAIDVGHGQLHGQIAANDRVVAIEGLNARDLKRDQIAGPIDLITCDVSFISLKLALPAALAIADPRTLLVALIKPQFEIGRDGLGKGGVVRDVTLLQAVCHDIQNWLQQSQKWQVLGVTTSPLEGGDGNREFLIAARKP